MFTHWGMGKLWAVTSMVWACSHSFTMVYDFSSYFVMLVIS